MRRARAARERRRATGKRDGATRDRGTSTAPTSSMTILGLIVLLVVGAICGAIAQWIVGYGGGGFFVSAGLGIVGAFIGSWLAAWMHLPAIFVVRIDSFNLPIVWSIVGAALLVAIVGLFRGRRRYYRDSYV
jgi:uncharacterized membrane protein YeaQ/YmgE (transglycosylase-associated protein family)